MAYPGVTEAVLVGAAGDSIASERLDPEMPDAEMPDAEAIAFIVEATPVHRDSLARHCIAMLPTAKRPDHLVFVPVLPRLGTGKTDRAQLRRLAVEWVARRRQAPSPPAG